ncbi:MAG: LVIVD repeat-containing protein [Candidatus Hodarchaeales archaeon]|jgi:hypothetical protein
MKKNGKLIVIFLVFTLVLNISILVSGSTPSKLSSSSSISAQRQYNLVELGQVVTGRVAYDLHVVDNMAYVIDDQSGLVIIDVSDPANPTRVGSYQDGTGSINGATVCIIDDLAFVADGFDGLEIIDISDSANPIEIGSFNGVDQVLDVSVVGDHAFVAGAEDGLVVVDISEPENPVEVTRYYHTGSYGEIFVAGDLAFISNCDFVDVGELQYADLTVLNVSDVNNIVEAGSTSPGDGNAVYYFHVSGNICYFTTHGSQFTLKILNISNLSNLREVGRYTYHMGEDRGIPNKMDVIDDIVYLACDVGGLRVLNVSDPTRPVEIGQYYDGGRAYDVQVVGNLAYVAERYDGLEIIQLYDENEDSSTSQSTGTSSFKSTGDAVIPGYELPVVIFVLISSFYVKKREKKEY